MSLNVGTPKGVTILKNIKLSFAEKRKLLYRCFSGKNGIFFGYNMSENKTSLS